MRLLHAAEELKTLADLISPCILRIMFWREHRIVVFPAYRSIASGCTARLEVDENGMILAYEDQWASL
ncbi:hypothetical protein ABU162_01365 [Paenibacillus thiaminolyticus]|uniref:hypothetical protein n=1 Tax=Paenibacillus thiaminolyticus TaxID=49283 RepID=UPI0035A584E4